MDTKKNKAIRKLKKQLDELKSRLDEMSMEINSLQVASENEGVEREIGSSEESSEEHLMVQEFREKEMEMANDMTWAAEELADIREKEKAQKKRKKKKGGKK